MKNYVALQEQLKTVNKKVFMFNSAIIMFYILFICTSNGYYFDQLLHVQETLKDLAVQKEENAEEKDKDITSDFAYRSVTREIALNVKVSFFIVFL